MEGHTLTHAELAHRFDYHPPRTNETKLRHEQVRETLLSAADQLVELTGAPCREQSTAITKLEEAMFWANAAIARDLGNMTPDQSG
jgi:hypothetical protein